MEREKRRGAVKSEKEIEAGIVNESVCQRVQCVCVISFIREEGCLGLVRLIYSTLSEGNEKMIVPTILGNFVG